ncbi:MAG: periplasmic polysaccharide biosynthesis/export protein [Desulfuromonas sp.]|uniref:SLBB domain-containing protein n=1 Tax=Desulfuromonas sp. TaxID=892 RepID=UPI000CB481E9|nr:SLBB domain-containing protein [Desulfuromonas sp.]PLX86057.1 MAG: periplasmic polysaccharide biosynthesis/export protein [Desulfuromonas sp.]
MKNIVFLSLFLTFLLSAGSALSAERGYRVGDGDVLKVTVYDHPDLTTTARISSSGTILFPLIGQLQVGGMTGEKVAGKISNYLEDGFIVNPQVYVFVEDFRSNKAIINGQVRKPGLYELSGPTALSELISKAGGLGAEAGDTITIKRKISSQGKEEKLLSVSLKSLMGEGNASLDIPIMDGDSVFVARAGIVYVTGQVTKPNAYTMDEKTSVIKAITMAGGFSELAAKGKVKIIRKVGGSERMLENVSMHMAVLPEDVIVVPESFF